ncbi:MAG: hypothetical protein JXD18_07565 [Anaerolineae bacterium]|nr:hypothetical protein [Anaerolineae bacterium]
MKKCTALFLAIVFLLTALGPAHRTTQAAGPDYRFGVIEAYDAPWEASALGAGWTRVTFRWNEIQPDSPEQWNLPITEEQLNLELAQGRQVVGLLTNTPVWATDMERGIGVPRGLYLGHNDPNNLWGAFLRNLVTRYAGRIDHWIIWNEPDIWDTYHQSWGGSVEDYAQLLRVSYGVIKETNPNGVVHLAAVTHWWDANYGRDLFMHRLIQVLISDPNAPNYNYYFDVATFHVYFQAENVYDLTTFYYNMLRGYGLTQPIWIVETNAAPSEDPARPVPGAQFHVTLDDQSAFIIQAMALGIAAGAQRIAVYKMIDTERDLAANPEPFGLVRADGTRRPAFTAYQVGMTYLAGFRSGTWVRRDDASVVVIDRGTQTTTVVWSRTPAPQSVILQAQTTSALLVDMWGRARLVYPERGYYYLDVAGCAYEGTCLIGGAPLMLVEDASGNPDVAPIEPAPTMPDVDVPELPTSTPALTYTPTPSATPTPSPTSTPTATPTPTVTPTPSPTPTPLPPTDTPTPTATPTPRPYSTPSTSRPSPWALPLTGLLALGLGAIAWGTRRRTRVH